MISKNCSGGKRLSQLNGWSIMLDFSEGGVRNTYGVGAVNKL
jgi:hypothetical protein